MNLDSPKVQEALKKYVENASEEELRDLGSAMSRGVRSRSSKLPRFIPHWIVLLSRVLSIPAVVIAFKDLSEGIYLYRGAMAIVSGLLLAWIPNTLADLMTDRWTAASAWAILILGWIMMMGSFLMDAWIRLLL